MRPHTIRGLHAFRLLLLLALAAPACAGDPGPGGDAADPGKGDGWGTARNDYTTVELLDLFAAGTLEEADPAWLVNARPRYRVEDDRIVVCREDWHLTWPRDLALGSQYWFGDAVLGLQARKHFDSAEEGMTFLTDGRRSGIGLTVNGLRRVAYRGSAAPRGALEAVALLYPEGSVWEGYTDYFRFLPDEGSAPPRWLVGVIEKEGELDAVFLMEKRPCAERRVPLDDPDLPGLSTDDLRRLWDDPAASRPATACAHAGTWAGKPLVDEVLVPGVLPLLGFEHQSWDDPEIGMVGTYRWPAALQHGRMIIQEGPEGTRLRFFPAGFAEELRGLAGTDRAMLGRFRFLLEDAAGHRNENASAFYDLVMSGLGGFLEWVVPGHFVQADEQGNLFFAGYYVITRMSDEVDPGEKDRFYGGLMFGGELEELVDHYGAGTPCRR